MTPPAGLRHHTVLLGLAVLLVVALYAGLPGGAEPTGRVIEVTVGEAGVAPPTILVHHGDRVELRLLADRPRRLLVEGYGLDQPVGPAEPAVVRFVASLSGRFSLDDAESRVRLGMLEVEDE